MKQKKLCNETNYKLPDRIPVCCILLDSCMERVDTWTFLFTMKQITTMAHSCITEVEKKFIGREYGPKKLKIKRATVETVTVFGGSNGIERMTSSPVEVHIDGIQMLHSYCPFCGKKIRQE